jgi:NitT/TauT family transport system permease protein
MTARGALAQLSDAAVIDHFDRVLIDARRHEQKRDSALVRLIGVGILIIFIGAWELAYLAGLVKPIFISNPQAVAEALWSLLKMPPTWSGMLATFSAALGGLVAGSLLGIGSGIVLAHMPVLRRAMRPYLTIFNAFPRPAFAPIFIMWFGLGALPKITVAVTIVFFVLLYNTMVGILSVDPDIKFLSRSLGMSKWQRFRMVELPHATPTIVAGLRLGAVYSVLGVVVSEIVAANEGLGQLLVQFTNQFDIAASFAVLALMALLAVILDIGVSLIQRRLSWSRELGLEA